MASEVNSGWACPSNSRKFHYFVDARSLCLKWMFFGQLQSDDGTPNSNDCKDCRNRLTKMNEPPKQKNTASKA